MNKIRFPETSENNSEIKLKHQRVKLDKLYNSKERELLQFLWAKKIEIDGLVNKMSELRKMRKDSDFNITIYRLEDDVYNKIEKLQNEVSERLKNYLAPLSDEEKIHTASFMWKNWFGLFVVANIEYFWKKLNTELWKMVIEAGSLNPIVVNNLDKFKIDYEQFAKALDDTNTESPFEWLVKEKLNDFLKKYGTKK